MESSDYRSREEYGRDERSLVKLPFTLLGTRDSRRAAKEMRSEWEGRDERGRLKKFFNAVSWSAKHGAPDYMAEEVYVALLYYSWRSGLDTPYIRLVPYQMLKLMGRAGSGKDYQRLKKSLNQLLGVTVHTNALWDEATRSYVEAGFGILDNWELKRGTDAPLFGEDGDGRVLEVRWNARLHEHFRRGRLKLLNVETYFGLPTPLSKRLYRVIDEAVLAGRPLEIDVVRLAHTRLGIPETLKYPSQVMQTLEPALKILEVEGLIVWRLEDSQTDSGKKLVIERPPVPADGTPADAAPGTSVPGTSVPGGSSPAPAETPEQERLAALSDEERARLKAKAVEMLDDYNRQRYERDGETVSVRAILETTMLDLLSRKA